MDPLLVFVLVSVAALVAFLFEEPIYYLVYAIPTFLLFVVIAVLFALIGIGLVRPPSTTPGQP